MLQFTLPASGITTPLPSDFDRVFGYRLIQPQTWRRPWHDFVILPESCRGATHENCAQTSEVRPHLHDTDSEIVLYAAVPGMSEQDISINVTNDIVTVSGERAISPPTDYSIRRQERSNIRVSHTFKLLCDIDTEMTTATVKDGMLTLRLVKAKQAKPRHIAVTAS